MADPNGMYSWVTGVDDDVFSSLGPGGQVLQCLFRSGPISVPLVSESLDIGVVGGGDNLYDHGTWDATRSADMGNPSFVEKDTGEVVATVKWRRCVKFAVAVHEVGVTNVA